LKAKRCVVVLLKTQGSVATHLRCGGIYRDSVITNYLSILRMKKFENQLIFAEVIRRTKMVPVFWSTLYAIWHAGKFVKSNNTKCQMGSLSPYRNDKICGRTPDKTCNCKLLLYAGQWKREAIPLLTKLFCCLLSLV